MHNAILFQSFPPPVSSYFWSNPRTVQLNKSVRVAQSTRVMQMKRKPTVHERERDRERERERVREREYEYEFYSLAGSFQPQNHTHTHTRTTRSTHSKHGFKTI